MLAACTDCRIVSISGDVIFPKQAPDFSRVVSDLLEDETAALFVIADVVPESPRRRCCIGV